VVLTSVQPGDIIEVDKKGRRFHAIVEEKANGSVRFTPIERGITYLDASAREVIAHWRKSRRS
jgi:hypothetical protein